MIDVTDAFRAIREMLKDNFPTLNLENADLKNPKRPSFYINLVNQIDNRQDSEFIRTIFSFDLIYFAESTYKGYADLMGKQSALSRIFLKPLTTKKYNKTIYLDVSQINFNPNTTDYVLNAVFNIEIIQLISDKNRFNKVVNPELMDDLVINTQI